MSSDPYLTNVSIVVPAGISGTTAQIPITWKVGSKKPSFVQLYVDYNGDQANRPPPLVEGDIDASKGSYTYTADLSIHPLAIYIAVAPRTGSVGSPDNTMKDASGNDQLWSDFKTEFSGGLIYSTKPPVIATPEVSVTAQYGKTLSSDAFIRLKVTSPLPAASYNLEVTLDGSALAQQSSEDGTFTQYTPGGGNFTFKGESLIQESGGGTDWSGFGQAINVKATPWYNSVLGFVQASIALGQTSIAPTNISVSGLMRQQKTNSLLGLLGIVPGAIM